MPRKMAEAMEPKASTRSAAISAARPHSKSGRAPILSWSRPAGIGACRIDEAHHRDDRRRPRQRQPGIARADDEEGFAEPRQREHRARGDDQPIGGAELADLLGHAAGPAPSLRHGGLLYAKHKDSDRQHRGDHREPEHRADVVVEEIHQADCHGRAERGADRVERLAQAERRASLGRPASNRRRAHRAARRGFPCRCDRESARQARARWSWRAGRAAWSTAARP